MTLAVAVSVAVCLNTIPFKGVDIDTLGLVLPMAVITILFRSRLPLSETKRSRCRPAVIGTLALIVPIQELSVYGTVLVPLTLAPSISMWNVVGLVVAER